MARKSWKRIAIALSGAIGLLGYQASSSAKSESPEQAQQLQARIEKARERLTKELGQTETTPEQARKVAQWYNWPNWGNWYNGWRNW
jgi:hypothetical protein